MSNWLRVCDPTNIPTIHCPKFDIEIKPTGEKGSHGNAGLYFVEEGEECYRENILSVIAQCLNNDHQHDKEEAFSMQAGTRPLVSSATYGVICKYIANGWTDWSGNSRDLKPIVNVWSRFEEGLSSESDSKIGSS